MKETGTHALDGVTILPGGQDRPIQTVAMVTFTVLAAAVYVALPMVVGALIQALGFTAQQAGLIAAADMLGAGVSALIGSLLISSGHWRNLLLAGICLLTLGNILSGTTAQFAVLFGYRICAGLGEGILMSIGNASIAETRNPDRVYGFSIAAQLAFGAMALYLTPWILRDYGVRGIFWSLAVLTFIAVALVRYMPDRPQVTPGKSVGWLFSAPSMVALGGVLTFFMAQGAVWAYLERVGVMKHIESSAIGEALAVSSMAGLAGALASSWLGVRRGRLTPLVAAACLALMSLAIVNGNIGFTLFAVAASVLVFTWNFAVPFQFGALAQIDPSRRTVALGTVVVFVGVTLGPALAAEIIGRGEFQRVIWLGMLFSILSVGLFAWLLWPLERATRVS
jgi:predicted MFS family arabinose efflux permease